MTNRRAAVTQWTAHRPQTPLVVATTPTQSDATLQTAIRTANPVLHALPRRQSPASQQFARLRYLQWGCRITTTTPVSMTHLATQVKRHIQTTGSTTTFTMTKLKVWKFRPDIQKLSGGMKEEGDKTPFLLLWVSSLLRWCTWLMHLTLAMQVIWADKLRPQAGECMTGHASSKIQSPLLSAPQVTWLGITLS